MCGVYILTEFDLTGNITNFGIRPITKKFSVSTSIGNNNKHN